MGRFLALLAGWSLERLVGFWHGMIVVFSFVTALSMGYGNVIPLGALPG